MVKNVIRNEKEYEAIGRVLFEGEAYRVIEGYDQYLITNYGRVFSAKSVLTTETLEGVEYYAYRFKELKASINNRGYEVVSLVATKRRVGEKKKDIKKFLVHDLVYRSFIGNFSKYYFRIKHLDGNKLNNNLHNLDLEFRKKDKAFRDKYYYQMKLLEQLNHYS